MGVRKNGGNTCAAEGRALLSTPPPQGVFGTFPNCKVFEIFEVKEMDNVRLTPPFWFTVGGGAQDDHQKCGMYVCAVENGGRAHMRGQRR